MTPRPSILVLTYTPFAREPRALKQVRYLRDSADVATAGFGPSPFPDIPHVELPDISRQKWGVVGRFLYLAALLLRVHRVIPALSALDAETARRLGGREWDIVIAHDLWSLAAALRAGARRGVVLDLHEYAPSESEHSLVWRLTMQPYVRWMLRTLASRVALVVTVGQGIADEYRRSFGFDSTVVVNATPYHDLEPRPVSSPLRLVHSGVAAPERRLDLMVDAVRASVGSLTLDFYLVESAPGELSALRERAAGDPRIRFRDPVPYQELVATLNGYDVGLSIFPPTTFNLAWCLPNKFFDFVQARLGVVVGPSPEMARYVEEYGFGEVLPDFTAESLARTLDALAADRVAEWKAAAHARAEELSGERQMAVWSGIVARLTREGGPASR